MTQGSSCSCFFWTQKALEPCESPVRATWWRIKRMWENLKVLMTLIDRFWWENDLEVRVHGVPDPNIRDCICTCLQSKMHGGCSCQRTKGGQILQKINSNSKYFFINNGNWRTRCPVGFGQAATNWTVLSSFDQLDVFQCRWQDAQQGRNKILFHDFNLNCDLSNYILTCPNMCGL